MTLPPIIDKRPMQLSEPNPFGITESVFVFEIDGLNVAVHAADPESAGDPIVRDLLFKRLEASATGVCPVCHEVRRKPNRTERRKYQRTYGKRALPQQAVLEHASGCTISDDALYNIIRSRYGVSGS